MLKKAIRMSIKQPSAHYRDPKVLEDNYISTLNLPSKTSIIGMITYLVDNRLKSNIDVAIIGNHKNKSLEFSRGETIDFWKEYRNSIKDKNQKQLLKDGKYYDYYKSTLALKRVMNYEVLNDIELTIFITCDDEKEFELILNALNKPIKYMNLGRKEDFCIATIPGETAKVVEYNTVVSTSKSKSIKEGIKLRNTYIKVELDNDSYNGLLNQGILLALPSDYMDHLNCSKDNRKIIYSYYIYLNNDGFYPTNIEVNVYKDEDELEVFTWL